MMNSDQDDPNWLRARELLRKHLEVPPLQNPDFINSQVMNAIRHEERPARPPVSLFRLAWAGAFMLIVALVVSVAFLPREFGFRDESEFISHVVAARAETSRLSVTSFRSPADRGVILWIEGSEYIPASEPVR
jgi:hypothetical protein